MPQSLEPWDVVVVGGGLAGGAAAGLLAKKGKRVLLLEKEAHAHHKVCGEFLSIEAQHYLHELGLDPHALGAASISNMRIGHGKNTASAKLPFGALSLSRRVLDEAVLREAQKNGAHIMRGAEVTALTQEQRVWRISVDGRDVIETATVFLATGKHDLRGWRRRDGIQNDFIGFKMHFTLSEAQKNMLAGHVELTLFDGGYAGLEPIEDGQTNLCLVVTKKCFAAHGKKWEALLAALCKSTPLLAERLAGLKACWSRPLSIFGIPYGFVYEAPSDLAPGLYRLGDQMAVIPSLSGYGMSIALYTASLAVESYLQRDLHGYYRDARRALLPLVRRTSFLSQIINRPITHMGILLLARVHPRIITMFAALNRISHPERNRP